MIVPFSWTSKKYINWQKNRDFSIFIKMFMVFWHKLVQSRKSIYGRDIKVIYYTHPRNPHSPAELKIQIFMHVHTGQNKKIPAYMFFDSLRLISNKILDSWSQNFQSTISISIFITLWKRNKLLLVPDLFNSLLQICQKTTRYSHPLPEQQQWIRRPLKILQSPKPFTKQ